MPIKKFRSLEEAERDLWLEPGDPRIWEGVIRRWHLHRLLGQPKRHLRSGVYRFTSIHDEQRAEQASPRRQADSFQ